MGKISSRFWLPAAVVIGICVYANTERDIKQQNADYLLGMIAGTYYLQENKCTEQFNLMRGNQYRQHIALDNGRVIENSGSWSLPSDAPEALREDTIILHGTFNPSGSGESISLPSKGTWDYSVPAHAFFGSESVSEGIITK